MLASVFLITSDDTEFHYYTKFPSYSYAPTLVLHMTNKTLYEYRSTAVYTDLFCRRCVTECNV